ncbi:MAG: hypothetical protein AVDCRST_MAG65-526 [uncultured Solirubrobacteraceae bacterium]|uniref:Uncharacterized protein n=1 Tax=uncultured Solirubrobacteraceae bacterium TaxID=1162706 RepID=A0A6J4RFE8_9ACTN|nr:MAG: hypothetical protein AVDCRST_MAG65-526 [uncultured Solirubrobacteraceae bacterium]
MEALERLAAELRGEGGLLAHAVRTPTAGADAELGRRAAAGPRTSEHPDDYALLVETIFEGYLQHYGEGRVVRPPDPELGLLAGDRLYALGLSRLAELGDLDAIAVLADVIASCAQAHAEGRDGDARGIWERGAAAIADGAAPGSAT